MNPQTALMPIDPAVSPQQIARVLPIRANLLPPEIMAGRNSRRIRVGLVGTVIVVVIGMVSWFLAAVGDKSQAEKNLEEVNAQVSVAQKRKQAHREITDLVAEKDAISTKLSTLLAPDLPWSTTLDTVRATGAAAGTTVTTVTGSLIATKDAAAAASGRVATLSINGTATDKKTIANYVDALNKLPGVSDAYLTNATPGEENVSFSITASLTKAALCGRFTTPCKTGGK